ncbi:Rpn family recombination-promoting nuclease/putative transposase [Providencia sp. PROV188]|jgi:predicted transposase/invertase (TIGR01784 family)|uniref:Rpn family recombination-promoting nuclease/putative transposase n=1 Tax=Providencia TaxID=586 RepID=UPI0012B5178B|nr:MULTISPECIES: Rpn family recombination-promoting nuclease/putative transposase [Providencia]MDR2989318.1 Rpn family recombination-promoting nuclease/putative transposase [Providencia alcalifaciens]MTB45554.1 Rpn family recombination-promoting nuclease/putative transposase [Providencia sp. wls1950]MTC46143.1 Rpn family recombination-promoting nuclease/putative transposase [Providencia sp. wls1922]WBM60330.1 Rpn family recombination-promoting nuclease/putative transposase [Providencia sp. PROV
MTNNASSIPHDAAFKGFMTKQSNARDFFELHLPEHIERLCDFDTLTLINSAFIDSKLRTRFSDVLYSVQTKTRGSYIYLLVEHQSTPDKLMGWRLMHYAFMAMNQHLQQGHKTLPLVVPILFYHGETSPYPYEGTWTQCLPHAEIAHDLYSSPFPLVDITVVEDTEIVSHRKIAVMELAMKHKKLRNDHQRVTEHFVQILNSHYNDKDDVITILNYLFIIMDSPYYTYIVETLIDQAENHRETIMNIAQRLKNEGKEKGKEETLQQVVLKSLQLGLSIDVIRKLTGLSDSEIQALN